MKLYLICKNQTCPLLNIPKVSSLLLHIQTQIITSSYHQINQFKDSLLKHLLGNNKITIHKLHTLATSCEELTHWKRLWCWEGLGAGGEGDDRGWDGWMASLTQWTWVSVNSGSWWWTGRPGVLQFMGSQRVRHDWATELNWTELFGLLLKNFPYWELELKYSIINSDCTWITVNQSQNRFIPNTAPRTNCPTLYTAPRICALKGSNCKDTLGCDSWTSGLLRKQQEGLLKQGAGRTQEFLVQGLWVGPDNLPS